MFIINRELQIQMSANDVGKLWLDYDHDVREAGFIGDYEVTAREPLTNENCFDGTDFTHRRRKTITTGALYTVKSTETPESHTLGGEVQVAIDEDGVLWYYANVTSEPNQECSN